MRKSSFFNCGSLFFNSLRVKELNSPAVHTQNGSLGYDSFMHLNATVAAKTQQCEFGLKVPFPMLPHGQAVESCP